MKQKPLLGGVIGALVTLAFAFALFLILNDLFSSAFLETFWGIVLSGLSILLAPFAGGFLAGLLSQPAPQKAGLITGLTAGLVVFIAWLVMTGLSIETILSGLAIVFVWVLMARFASGFAVPKQANHHG